MGTNYYVRPNICDKCGRTDDPIHIGKCSSGWKFLFNATKRKTKRDWFEFLDENAFNIFDEYGNKKDLETFKELIQSKEDGLDNAPGVPGHYRIGNEEWTKDGIRFYPGEFS